MNDTEIFDIWIQNFKNDYEQTAEAIDWYIEEITSYGGGNLDLIYQAMIQVMENIRDDKNLQGYVGDRKWLIEELKEEYEDKNIIKFSDTKKVKQIIEPLINQYKTIQLDDIEQSKNAPTIDGKEIEIILFPKENTDTNKYYRECIDLFDVLRKERIINKMTKDITKDNTFNFIYIIT